MMGADDFAGFGMPIRPPENQNLPIDREKPALPMFHGNTSIGGLRQGVFSQCYILLDKVSND